MYKGAQADKVPVILAGFIARFSGLLSLAKAHKLLLDSSNDRLDARLPEGEFCSVFVRGRFCKINQS